MKKNIMENKNNSAGLGSGFLLGLLLGILITLLFTTKKGREILRELIDKLMYKLSHLDESLEKIKPSPKLDAEDDEDDYVKPEPKEIKKETRYLAAQSTGENQESEEKPAEKIEEKEIPEKSGKHEKLSKRLFFRKAPFNT